MAWMVLPLRWQWYTAKCKCDYFRGKKVIDKVKIEDLHVYVDVSKIDKAGTYEQPLIVEGKNKLATYAVKNATVTIAVKEK